MAASVNIVPAKSIRSETSPYSSAETNRRPRYVERDMRQRELARAEGELPGKLRYDLRGLPMQPPAPSVLRLNSLILLCTRGLAKLSVHRS